jgi:hypothetical protein
VVIIHQVAEGNSVHYSRGPKFVTIVPKRVFAAGDLERFRDIVNRSIPSRQAELAKNLDL